jgi:hypothetical protein
MNEKPEKPWIKNSPNMIVVYSIFAAIAGGLLVFILQDNNFCEYWKWPVLFFAFSFFLFSLTAERTSEAILEDNVKKRIAYMFLYDVGVILLFFGGALTIHYKYSGNFLLLMFIAGVLSFPWIYDVGWLICSNNKKFNEYADELEGNICPPESEPRWWGRLFNIIRSFHKRCTKLFPHDGIYTRLQRSPIHGVGVFAIRDIPKGTGIFKNDDNKMIWVNKDDISNIDMELLRLYDDFSVNKNGKLGCPKNFNMLTVGWYINESKDNPNVCCNDNYDFIALRDIKKGEELTVNYSTYSEHPKGLL